MSVRDESNASLQQCATRVFLSLATSILIQIYERQECPVSAMEKLRMRGVSSR